jgi:ubiquinone/menaquinone biosynthesis C-methylase UbiE
MTGKSKQSSENPVKGSDGNWDSYWSGRHDNEAFTNQGAGHPAIRQFWMDVFGSLTQAPDKLRLADFCSGNGAVVAIAFELFASDSPLICCIDHSSAAIQSLTNRFSSAQGIVSDVRSTPLQDASYLMVTSQFGIEYAGTQGVDEMLRVLAPGGRLALLLHYRDGVIFQTCRRNLKAVNELLSTQILRHSRRMFNTGYALLNGGDPEPYKVASEPFFKALDQLPVILGEWGQDVASGSIFRLHTDISNMLRNIKNHRPEEVLSWLDDLETEFSDYIERMQLQLDAALDTRGFHQLCERIIRAGLEVQKNEVILTTQNAEPLAWALVASKTA